VSEPLLYWATVLVAIVCATSAAVLLYLAWKPGYRRPRRRADERRAADPLTRRRRRRPQGVRMQHRQRSTPESVPDDAPKDIPHKRV